MYKIALAVALALVTVFNSNVAQAATKLKVENVIEEGVNKTVFHVTDTGRIVFVLPLEIIPDDTVSGSIIYKAYGKNKSERESNLKELKTYSVQLRRAEIIPEGKLTEEQLKKGLPAPIATSKKTTLTGKIPLKTKGVEVTLLLEDRKKKYKRIQLEEAPQRAYPEKGSYFVPTIAQGNHPVVLKGQFDGVAKNTVVTVDSAKCKVLAESPREVIFRSPIGIVGKAKLAFKDGSNSVETDIVNLKLRLRAKKLKLKMGEKTQLYAKVEGVGDTESSVDLVIKNLTPDVVSIMGGDEQVVQIPAGGHK